MKMAYKDHIYMRLMKIDYLFNSGENQITSKALRAFRAREGS